MDKQQAKRESGQWAYNLISDGSGVILDLETTGTNRFGNDEPVQIGIIDLQGSVLFDSLIKPVKPVPPDTAAFHGITNEMLVSQPTFQEVYHDLYRLLERRVCVIYNAGFDTKILANAAKVWRVNPLQVHDQCAMLKFAGYRGDWNAYRQNWAWATLDQALAYCGVTTDDIAHTAIGDCQRTLAVINAMAAWYEVNIVAAEL